MKDYPSNLHSFEYGTGNAPNRWLLLPACTLLPLIRAPLGYDLVRPQTAIARTAAILGVGYVGQCVFSGPQDFRLLSWFACAYLAASLMRFFRRWLGQGSSEIHTSEAGYSFLARLLPLPVAVTEIAILPALIAFIGWKFWNSGLSPELGAWLMLGGASLALMGNWEHRRHWSQARAMNDDALRAQSYGDQMQVRERRARRGI